MKQDFTLVMTASVNPKGMQGLSAESQNGREGQYIKTLLFYVKKACIQRILFVENSNWDLSRIKLAVSSDKVEYLSLDENNFPREWGKGYGEFLLLDRAVDCLSSAYMVKVTGRFPILNIETMIMEFLSRKPLLLSVDVVRHNLYRCIGLNWNSHACRTIVWAVNLGFYMKNIQGRYREIPSRFSCAEKLMENIWEKNKDVEGVYGRFKHEPHLSGYAGSLNYAIITANNYDSVLARIKRGVRQLLRLVAPWLWI